MIEILQISICRSTPALNLAKQAAAERRVDV